MDIFLQELQNESPMLVNLIMRSIYSNNQRFIRHIGSRMFGIQYTLKGIYSHGGLLYFHVEVRNNTNVSFDVDFFNFVIQDKRLARRTTVQEIVLRPVRAHNFVTTVAARRTENIVLTFPIFTLPPDKVVRFGVNERGGGRHQHFLIDGDDLMRAREIREFHIR
jgi:conjugative transposon TraN protein